MWAKLLLLGTEFRRYDEVWFLDADQTVLPGITISFPTTSSAVSIVHDINDNTGRYREFNMKWCENINILNKQFNLRKDPHSVYLSNIVVLRPRLLLDPSHYMRRTQSFFRQYGMHCNRLHDQTIFHVLFWDELGSIRQPKWLKHHFHFTRFGARLHFNLVIQEASPLT
tara:strand:- start:1136 stop:1642 length:507 start_codon:yes stop_codon:yes gene_type:complete